MRAYASTLQFRFHVERTKENFLLIRPDLHPAHVASLRHNDAGFVKVEPFAEARFLAALIPTERRYDDAYAELHKCLVCVVTD